VQEAGLNAQVFTQVSDAYPRGKVMAQWPHASETATDGSAIALLVSAGPPAEGTMLTSVPDVIGLTDADAHARLDQVGLRSQAMGAYSATVPAGVVFGQLPEERVQAAAPKKTSPWLWVGLAVAALAIIVALIVIFSGGKTEAVAVPNVVGMTQAEAESALEAKGLAVGKITEKQVADTEPGTVLTQDPIVGTEVDTGSKVDLEVSSSATLTKVPDVVGRTQATAEQLIKDADLEPSVTEAPSDSVPAGSVVSQSPTKDQLVPLGTVVGIVVSTGPEQKLVKVPNVVGLSQADAEKELSDAGLETRVIENYSDTAPTGKVMSQAPTAGASVGEGTEIAIIVSQGPPTSEGETAQVPNVVGKTLSEATAVLKDVGFEVTSFEVDGSGKPANTVLYQAPASGDTAPLGSQVALIVSSGS
jgi:serine/threonine-protein kinase